MRPRGTGARTLFGLAAAGLVALMLTACGSGARTTEGALSEVMGDRHAHSLRVDPANPDDLLLGLHGGLYRSSDAGLTWRALALDGKDAMNVSAAGPDQALWVAGHDVLERSLDGGATFEPVEPEGLPSLDLHGFAVRDGRPSEIFAAIAGEGLYRSEDGGGSFDLVSREVGAGVFGLAAPRSGALLAADPRRGLLTSDDGGRSFTAPLEGAGLVGVAVSPHEGTVVVAGEQGISVSRDGGRRFADSEVDAPVAAIAVAPSDPRRIYAIAADGRVLISRDGARTWSSR